MTTRRALLLSAAGVVLVRHAGAQTGVPPEVAADLPGARLQGSGRMRYFGLHVLDARLWTLPGFTAGGWASQPLALELQYARALVGPRIAQRSLDEMRKVGTVPTAKAAPWLAEMTAAFPDVAKGDRITGVSRPGEAARFFVNGQFRREVRDAEFQALFFGIWLSPRTSEPALREGLLGPDKATP
jgi:hypothetical protein